MSSSSPEAPRQPYSAMPESPPGVPPSEPYPASPPAPPPALIGQVPAAPNPDDPARYGLGLPPGLPPAGSGAAPPPAGPGVTPPFPAPPVEGRTTRLWLGLGAAGLAVVLCCGGGLAAGIGLVFTGAEAVNEQAQAVVGGYLDDVRAGRYGEAYDALCPDLRAQETARQFAERVAEEPEIEEYDVGDVRIQASITVPVAVRYSDGDGETLFFWLEQDSGTGELEVCDIDR